MLLIFILTSSRPAHYHACGLFWSFPLQGDPQWSSSALFAKTQSVVAACCVCLSWWHFFFFTTTGENDSRSHRTSRSFVPLAFSFVLVYFDIWAHLRDWFFLTTKCEDVLKSFGFFFYRHFILQRKSLSAGFEDTISPQLLTSF